MRLLQVRGLGSPWWGLRGQHLAKTSTRTFCAPRVASHTHLAHVRRSALLTGALFVQFKSRIFLTIIPPILLTEIAAKTHRHPTRLSQTSAQICLPHRAEHPHTCSDPSQLYRLHPVRAHGKQRPTPPSPSSQPRAQTVPCASTASHPSHSSTR